MLTEPKYQYLTPHHQGEQYRDDHAQRGVGLVASGLFAVYSFGYQRPPGFVTSVVSVF
jgi:hypothetical protein